MRFDYIWSRIDFSVTGYNHSIGARFGSSRQRPCCVRFVCIGEFFGFAVFWYHVH